MTRPQLNGSTRSSAQWPAWTPRCWPGRTVSSSSFVRKRGTALTASECSADSQLQGALVDHERRIDREQAWDGGNQSSSQIGALRADLVHLPFSAQYILYRCNKH